jgi:hypothetical protein
VRNDWDLPRLEAWSDYCADNPPLRAMVQAYLGIKGQPKAVAPEDTDILHVLSVFPQGI